MNDRLGETGRSIGTTTRAARAEPITWFVYVDTRRVRVSSRSTERCSPRCRPIRSRKWHRNRCPSRPPPRSTRPSRSPRDRCSRSPRRTETLSYRRARELLDPVCDSSSTVAVGRGTRWVGRNDDSRLALSGTRTRRRPHRSRLDVALAGNDRPRIDSVAVGGPMETHTTHSPHSTVLQTVPQTQTAIGSSPAIWSVRSTAFPTIVSTSTGRCRSRKHVNKSSRRSLRSIRPIDPFATSRTISQHGRR